MPLNENLSDHNKIRILHVIVPPQAEKQFLIDLIHTTKDMTLVGAAMGLDDGLAMIVKLSPDIVLVDDCPDLAEFVTRVRKISTKIAVLLLTEHEDRRGAQHIVDALAAGAFDYIAGLGTKPSISNLLLSKIHCCSIKQFSRMAHVNKPQSDDSIAQDRVLKPIYTKQKDLKYDVIVVGVSTGGPEALMEFLPSMPRETPIPIVIVLHMPKEFTGAMAASLDRKCQLRVSEAKDGEELVKGRIYLAPGGVHCSLVHGQGRSLQIQLIDSLPENGCRPSVNILFRSAAITCARRSIGVILTGMGNDGTNGATHLKQTGAPILVQDEASSVVWGMPGSVVRAQLADDIVPISQMASRLNDLLRGVT